MHQTIYIYYPRGLETGGPEALHQLCDSLRRHGQNAFLVPIRATRSLRRVADYSVYDAPEAEAVADSPENAVVVPETPVPGMPAIRSATVYKWWLSVNNSSSEWMSVRRRELRTGLPDDPLVVVGVAPFAKALLLQSEIRERRKFPSEVVHLTQSQYAWSAVYEKTRLPPTMLSDYTSHSAATHFSTTREPRVAFYPTKSGRLARRVAARLPEVEFVPIKDMSREQVGATLGSCAVFLDLGAHPGKDRMPREAALADAVVVAARRGSASYHVDMPIPLEHKVFSDGKIVEHAASTLRAVLADFPAARSRQEPYRAAIRAERDMFDSQVRRIFVDGTLGSDATADKVLFDAERVRRAPRSDS
jgi:hypothetical protein